MMKKLLALTCFTLLSLSLAVGVFAQEKDETPAVNAEAVNFAEDDGRQPLFLLFSEGPAFSWLTRIKKQSGRSNFVFNDFLLGLFFRMDMPLTEYFTPMVRLAALYPLISTFNQVPQKPNNPLHFGVDMNLGLSFKIFDFSYFRLNTGPALHMFFLNSERWNYFDLGAAAFLGMELPMSPGWTVVCNGFASLDNGNLGGNRDMEPFNITYQYQLDIGVRYSRKLRNKTSLFPDKQPVYEDIQLFSR
jgi:hypothetical protein